MQDAGHLPPPSQTICSASNTLGLPCFKIVQQHQQVCMLPGRWHLFELAGCNNKHARSVLMQQRMLQPSSIMVNHHQRKKNKCGSCENTLDPRSVAAASKNVCKGRHTPPPSSTSAMAACALSDHNHTDGRGIRQTSNMCDRS